jgi:hypothetical protein
MFYPEAACISAMATACADAVNAGVLAWQGHRGRGIVPALYLMSTTKFRVAEGCANLPNSTGSG